jgi:CheY-like chemotaxis protein
VAATIVREHKGMIGVESPVVNGKGSIFFFEFQTVDPNLVPLNDTLKEPQSPSQPVPDKSHRMPLLFHAQISPASEASSPPLYHRALIVDDSHVVRKMLAKCITSQFHHIEHVCPLAPPLVPFSPPPPPPPPPPLSHSVFSLPLKASDGVEAVNAVKKHLQKGEIINVIFLDSFMPNMGGIEACKIIRSLGYAGVILAISGNVIPEDIQEFLDAGADYFLGKPFKLEQLQSVLSGMCFLPSLLVLIIAGLRLLTKVVQSKRSFSYSLVNYDQKDRKYSLSKTGI